ncbi:MAG: M48 family metalloprotease, partial [Actinobacteria bacterium]|nr:M48 family metalloprotease [Actinomycetota bacterium]
MTVMRIVCLATLSGSWIVVAALLWRTSVPPLHVPELDARALFDDATLERTGLYRNVLTALWVLGVLAGLAGLTLLARRGARHGARDGARDALLSGALAGGAVYVTLWLAQLPFRLGAHWWRRRYDVSDLDYLRFVGGQWSTTLGELLLACIAGAAVVAVGRLLGRRAWVGLWAAFVALAAGYVLVYPALLAPRLRPLEDPALAAEIRVLAHRSGLGETTVEVRKARERTRAVNAEALGAGPTTRVILWDTLLEPDVGRGEIRFVAAHELAHVARRHPWRGVA